MLDTYRGKTYHDLSKINEIVLQTNPDGRSIQENHVTFLIEDLGGASELEVHLIDALSERVLDKLENVEVAITL